MLQKAITKTSKLRVNTSKQGEPLEHKIERIVNGKEKITDGAPIIYTERKDGVHPSHNIRTDRWEIAADKMDKVSKSFNARREERHKPKPKEDGKPEPTQGKPETGTQQS